MAPPQTTLEDSKIEIEDDPGKITSLPPDAKKLRKLLLNFKGILSLGQKRSLEDYCVEDDYLTTGNDGPTKDIFVDSGHKTYELRWKAALDLRDKARNLVSREKEPSWQGLMTNFAFQDINEQSSDQGIPLMDLLSWGSDQLFTNAVPIRGQLSDEKDHQPKPDFWFGLGIYNKDQLSRLRGLELSDRGVDYFTQENLQYISMARPDDFFYQPMKSREDAAFPWMVAEMKKEFGDEDGALRQAANASHTCLVLCERLAEPADFPAPLIVAITSIGPEVKVFITYKVEEQEIYRMACIWTGNIQHILHAVKFRRIVDQLMFWALRIFKPWVTDCLEEWYSLLAPDGSESDLHRSSSIL